MIIPKRYTITKLFHSSNSSKTNFKAQFKLIMIISKRYTITKLVNSNSSFKTNFRAEFKLIMITPKRYYITKIFNSNSSSKTNFEAKFFLNFKKSSTPSMSTNYLTHKERILIYLKRDKQKKKKKIA